MSENWGAARKFVVVLGGMLLACQALAQGAPERKDVHIAAGGKAALYYLPLTIAERLGYFKDEGLSRTRD